MEKTMKQFVLKINRLLLIFILTLTTVSFGQFGFGKKVVSGKAFQSLDAVQPGGEIKIALKLKVDEGWHINSIKPNEKDLIASKLTVEKPFKLLKTKFPQARDIKFSFSEIPVSVYEGEFLVGALVKIPDTIALGRHNLKVTFSYQACNNASCLPPNDFVDTVEVNVVGKSVPVNEINSEIFSNLDLKYTAELSSKSEGGIGGTLAKSGLLLSIILVFLGGLALNLTPCIYPLIPITIGYFGGQSEGNTKRLAMLGLLYVLGMALTYSVIGVVTAMSGAVFGALLQNTYVIIFIVLVFILLALSQFNVYEFKLPDSWVMKAGGARGGAFGAFFMGLTMGIVAAPCIGPFVIGLLTYVASKGDVLYGFLMFFFLAIGLGTPYIFLAIFSGKIKSLPRAGEWMQGVEHIFGLILFGAAIYFAQPLFSKTIAHYFLPVFLILSAVYLIFIDRKGNNVKVFYWIKIAFSVLIFAASVYALWPTEKQEIQWQKYSDVKYEASLNANHRIVIDFYADWCIPCKELDAKTFTDAKVIKIAKNFDAYKVDMTKTMSDETERIRKKFDIKGMPTVLIFNSNGVEVQRLTGFVEPEEFYKILREIK
jgi:thiol:disulfide interchange protein DsbD